MEKDNHKRPVTHSNIFVTNTGAVRNPQNAYDNDESTYAEITAACAQATSGNISAQARCDYGFDLHEVTNEVVKATLICKYTATDNIVSPITGLTSHGMYGTFPDVINYGALFFSDGQSGIMECSLDLLDTGYDDFDFVTWMQSAPRPKLRLVSEFSYSGTAIQYPSSYSTLRIYDVYLDLVYIKKVPVKVKVNGQWQAGSMKAKVRGSWVDITAGYVKVNGEWESIE